MSIDWFDPAEREPEDRQACLIMPHDHGGLTTVGVFGPINWNAGQQAFIDVFRDSEAGTLIAKADVGCWTPWEPLAPPEGLPTPRMAP